MTDARAKSRSSTFPVSMVRSREIIVSTLLYLVGSSRFKGLFSDSRDEQRRPISGNDSQFARRQSRIYGTLTAVMSVSVPVSRRTS